MRCLDLSDNDLIKLGNFPPLKRWVALRGNQWLTVGKSAAVFFFWVDKGIDLATKKGIEDDYRWGGGGNFFL